jgi:imidazolonepropionase-like amidohydrolase
MMMLWLWLTGCATTAAGGSPLDQVSTAPLDPPETPPGVLSLEGAVVLVSGGGASTAPLVIEDGLIVTDADASATVVDVSGRFIVPAFIDSHVHFAYQPDIAELLDNGVVAGVDLAAPVESLAADLSPMAVVWAGPMVTAEDGYPTQSWGSAGYGVECEGGEAAVAAVDALADAGAGIIKLPITSAPVLGEAALIAAAARATERGLPVAVHALSDAQAALGASIGAGVLAHTPTDSLSEQTISAWSDKVVVSTLAAFGGSSAAVENLRALRVAGATVLYGTDFGNLRTAGISGSEIALLVEAGLSGEDILLAATQVPAAHWGLDTLGQLSAGREASFLVLSGDPREDPMLLAEPREVWVRGVRRR